VPTIRLEHLSDAQVRAYVIADNKLAENAGWDQELLALELQGLAALDLDFDLTVTGFETPELDLLIGDGAGGEPEEADRIPDIDPRVAAVSRLGDLWQIGRHRLLCGDATKAESYTQLMENRRAQMVLIDPPYNVPVDGHVCGLGSIKHAEFAMASGEMSAAEFTAFLESVLRHHASYSVDGAIHFVCMDWRHIGELLAAGQAVYSELKNLCVWCKTNGGMGSLYRSQHELVFVFKAGSAAHVNNVELGRHGRYRTNVWRYPGLNSFGQERANTLLLHPTVKPVALVADAILDCSRRGAVVLDGFAGAGTTLLAAERTGRTGYGIEIDPRYVDVAIRRLATHAGLDAVHAESGKAFAKLEASRAAEARPNSRTAPDNLEQARKGREEAA
jgi:16S rRNA G966 N2-methylase RsmD